MSEVLPPGNILQNMYLKKLLKRRDWKTFVEIGAGNGYVSREILKSGLSGLGCDLNLGACEKNRIRNKSYIDEGLYEVKHQDFLSIDFSGKFDLIISCMVLEHLNEIQVDKFIDKAKNLLTRDGSIVFFVPASMRHWGIEDEMAGHVKRYEFDDFITLASKNELVVSEINGLTYPLSNILFGISNYLVKKHESDVLAQSPEQKTIYTGNRNVPFKTTFPSWMRLFLNELVLIPFYVLQRLNAKNNRSMVIVAELSVDRSFEGLSSV